MNNGLSVKTALLITFFAILLAALLLILIITGSRDPDDSKTPSQNNSSGVLPTLQKGQVTYVAAAGDQIFFIKNGEIWSAGETPTKLIEDGGITDFVFNSDGKRVIYLRVPKASPQSNLFFIREASAHGSIMIEDVVAVDIADLKPVVLGTAINLPESNPNDLPRWSANSEEVLYINDSGAVVRKDFATAKSQVIEGAILRYISSDNLLAVIPGSGENNPKFTIKDLSTGESLVADFGTIASSASIYSYAWSPDNTSLALVMRVKQEGVHNDRLFCQLYVYYYPNQAFEKLGPETHPNYCGYGNSQPLWSPTGHYLQFEHLLLSINPPTFPELRITLPTGPNNTALGIKTGVTWSNDGTKFAENIDGRLVIYDVESQTSILVDEATDNWSGRGYRTWSTDGATLYYIVNGVLKSVNSDGSNMKVIAN